MLHPIHTYTLFSYDKFEYSKTQLQTNPQEPKHFFRLKSNSSLRYTLLNKRPTVEATYPMNLWPNYVREGGKSFRLLCLHTVLQSHTNTNYQTVLVLFSFLIPVSLHFFLCQQLIHAFCTSITDGGANFLVLATMQIHRQIS